MKNYYSLALGVVLGASVVSSMADYSIQIQTTTSGTSPNAVFDVGGVTKVDNTFFGQITVNGNFVGSPVNFGQNGANVVPQLNGYLSAGTLNVTSGTLFGGSSASVQLFAWKGASDYATAAVTPGAKIGNSSVLNIPALGGSSQDLQNTFTVPNLTAVSGFTMSTVAVPEPATVALGLFGVAGLLARRRK
jgi:hypothetical protein